MEPTFRETLEPACVSTRLVAMTKDAVLGELARLLAAGSVPLSVDLVRRVLTEREQLASTGVGSGVAIPHGRLRELSGVKVALALHPEGVHFDAIDGGKVHLFVAVLASDREPTMHLRILARASRLLRDPAVRQKLLAATDPASLYATFVAEDERLG